MAQKVCYSLAGYFQKFYTKILNFPAFIGRKLSNRVVIEKIYYLESLLFIYKHNVEEQYCFAAACDKDYDILNSLSKAFRNLDIIVACEDGSRLNKNITVISFDEIVNRGFSTVVIPTNHSESEIERKLYFLFEKSNQNFSIWDPYSYFLAGRIYSGRTVGKKGFTKKKYREVNLSLSEGNIVLPSYYANWGYINYLLCEELQDGMNVLDMWAGSGCIGFSLKKEFPNIKVSLADVNYFAVLSMKHTLSEDNDLEGSKVFLSDVFESMVPSEQFDLIVGNPPCGRGYFSDFIQIGGADDEWKSHLSFFNNAYNYLKPRGKICIVENICDIKEHSVEYAECFYKNFDTQFPKYRITKMLPLKGSFLSIIIIEKR